ncbi:MAG TPA: hypothetical protein VN367_10180 [Chlorobaculum sp.]|jgi:hypothetical protein|nr:hypothetical protein [Chlorobaculum sp.]
MLVLEKVTFHYNEIEDRICMSADVVGGEKVLFWFTQRFSRRIADALCAYCEKSRQDSPVIDRNLLLSCQQREAEWANKSPEPVKAEAATRSFFPATVNLTFSPEQVQMRFPLQDGEVAAMPFSQSELRQWLSILYRTFRLAEWSTDSWPAWLKQDGPVNN